MPQRDKAPYKFDLSAAHSAIDRAANGQHKAVDLVGQYLAALYAKYVDGEAYDDVDEKVAVHTLVERLIGHVNTMTFTMQVDDIAMGDSLLQSLLEREPIAKVSGMRNHPYTASSASSQTGLSGFDSSNSSSSSEASVQTATETRTDWRILITLPWNVIARAARWKTARERADQVRKRIVKVADLSPDSFTVAVTYSGYAVHTHTEAAFDSIMRDEIRKDLKERFFATSVGPPDRWAVYEVENVPDKLMTADNGVIAPTTEDQVRDEACLQTNEKPIWCRKVWDNPDSSEVDSAPWILTFCKEVKPFRLFEESKMSCEITHKPLIGIHDPGCQEYCDQSRCSKPARCNRCSSKLTEHPPGLCTGPPRCNNCSGPYLAGHDNCPAAPFRRNGEYTKLTKRQRETVRKAGLKMFMAEVASRREEPLE